MIAGDKRVTGLKVKNSDTGKDEILESDGIFLAIGHRPNTAFLDNQVKTDDMGYIIVNPRTTETNIPGVFACGDVQDYKYRQAVTAEGSGLHGCSGLRKIS